MASSNHIRRAIGPVLIKSHDPYQASSLIHSMPSLMPTTESNLHVVEQEEEPAIKEAADESSMPWLHPKFVSTFVCASPDIQSRLNKYTSSEDIEAARQDTLWLLPLELGLGFPAPQKQSYRVLPEGVCGEVRYRNFKTLTSLNQQISTIENISA